MSKLLRRLPLAAVLLALTGALLLAPAAPASPSAARHATAAKKVKACKKHKGETRKHWLKRCKCGKLKHGETRAKFKKRCPGAKVPKRKPAGGQTPVTPPSGGGAPPVSPPAQSDVDKVTQALIGTQLQYFTYSNTTGSSDDERYHFCSGSFTYTRNRTGISTIAYQTNAGGTWRIVSATVNPDQVSGTAVIHYDLTSFQSTDVDPAPPSSADVPVTFNGTKMNLGGREYDATKVAC
jgi:hypothetical protein